MLTYSRAQGLNGRVVSIFVLFGALIGGPRVQRYMLQAHRRGRRSACLVVQCWEKLLPLPIETVRARLNIAPLAEVHPHGLLRFVDDEVVRGAA